MGLRIMSECIYTAPKTKDEKKRGSLCVCVCVLVKHNEKSLTAETNKKEHVACPTPGKKGAFFFLL